MLRNQSDQNNEPNIFQKFWNFITQCCSGGNEGEEKVEMVVSNSQEYCKDITISEHPSFADVQNGNFSGISSINDALPSAVADSSQASPSAVADAFQKKLLQPDSYSNLINKIQNYNNNKDSNQASLSEHSKSYYENIQKQYQEQFRLKTIQQKKEKIVTKVKKSCCGLGCVR